MRDEVAASGLLDDAGVAYAVPTARGGPAAVVAAPRAGAGAAARAEERQRAPAAAGAAAEGAAGAGEEEEEGAVDLPRLYEHFMFAMAHKGQHLGAWRLWRACGWLGRLWGIWGSAARASATRLLRLPVRLPAAPAPE